MLAAALPAATSAATQYVYDDLGRIVQVTFANGAAIHYAYDATGNVVAINKANSNAVAISTFLPTNGTAGTVVALHGSGFAPAPGQNTVKFNGVTANVTAASSTQLTVVVPSGATTGPISVMTSSGTTTSSSAFVITALAINSFSPTVGLPGTAVTVYGTGFAPAMANNQLKFLNTNATLLFASTTQLRTTVPAGATSGPLTITTPAGTATSTVDFFIPPGGHLPTNVVTTGRLPINGEPQTYSITTANRIGILLFDGLQAENRNVVLTGVSMAGGSYLIYTPSGVLLFTGSIRNNGVDDLPALPESGIYSLVLNPGANTGNISIRVVTDDIGTIPLDGPKVISLTPGQNAVYTFEGVGGQGYSLVRTAYVSTPTGANASVIVQDMNATQIKSCGPFHSGAGNCDFTLPTTGTYRVRINPGGIASTSATVVLSPDLMSPAVLNSPPMRFLSTLPGQNIRYSFEAAAGQSITFSYHNGVNAQGTLYIYRPDGSVLDHLPNDFNGASYRYMDAVATTSGTHTAVVFINGNNVGNMDVNITTDADGAIPVNASFTTSLTYGQNGSYTFEGIGGQGYSLIRTAYVSTPAGDSAGVAIKSADGTQIRGCGSFASNVGTCDFTLPTSGTYRVSVNPSDPTAVTFTLVLSEDLAGTLTLNAPAVRFAPALPGQNIRYAFDAMAGQNIRFGYTNGTSPQGILYIYKPDGSVLAKLPNDLNTATSRFLDATTAEAGTYSAVVYIYGNWAGSMNVYVATR